MNKSHSKIPSEQHTICRTKFCNNYYNINYKNTNGRCKHCNTKPPCELCDDGLGKRRADNIFVCDKCDEKYPIEEN